MLAENFQRCLGNYAVISRNHPQLKIIQGGLNRDLAKLRYIPRNEKCPLQKIIRISKTISKSNNILIL